MATFDEDLNQIERDVRTLKIEYEQYFGGGRARPPTDTQWRVESLIRRCNERMAQVNFGQRFRFNNLAQTYAKYQDMWRKKLIQRESGASNRHFGSAAKAIEAERLRKRTEVLGRLNSGESATTDAAATGFTENGGSSTPAFALSVSDPANEAEKVNVLYDKLMEARTTTGETEGAPTLKVFERFVRQKTRDLKNKGGNEIEYSVSIESGQVKLKARIAG